jgi:hypothetical protein
MTTPRPQPPDQPGRRAVWTAGLVVAAGAGVATAHALYQVAAAARVPTPIAWLYPLITDGLALVAYAATSRLADTGRRYAAGIVVLAAGLSGLAQAIYLAGGIATTTTAPVGLRFGVGAWPAGAAALTAHLLHLIGTAAPAADHSATSTPTRQPLSFESASNSVVVQPCDPSGVQPYNPSDVQPYNATADPGAVQLPRTTAEPDTPAVQPARSSGAEQTELVEGRPARSGSAGGGAPASERARHAARSHYALHGRLPTASELMALAQVARGTAGTVLKDLRNNRPALHLVTADPDPRTDQ